MMTKCLLVVFLLLPSSIMFAQEEQGLSEKDYILVTDKDGNQYHLKKDNTWEVLPPKPMELKATDGKIVVLHHDGTWTYKKNVDKTNSLETIDSDNSKSDLKKNPAKESLDIKETINTESNVAEKQLNQETEKNIAKQDQFSQRLDQEDGEVKKTETTKQKKQLSDIGNNNASIINKHKPSETEVIDETTTNSSQNLSTVETSPEESYFIKKVKGKKVDYVISFDTTKWGAEQGNIGDYAFQLIDENAYAMMIAANVKMSLEKLEEIAISNAKSQAPDLKVLEKETKNINGKDVLSIQMQGRINSMLFTFYGYLYAGEDAAIQFITYTVSKLFDEYKPQMETLLNGLAINSK